MGKVVDHARIKIGDLVTLDPKGCSSDHTGVVVDTRLYECDVYWFCGYHGRPVREYFKHLAKLS